MAAFTEFRKVLNPAVVWGSRVASTIFIPGVAALRARQYAFKLLTNPLAPSPWSLAPINKKSTLDPLMLPSQESMVAARGVTVAMLLPETASLPPCGNGDMADCAR